MRTQNTWVTFVDFKSHAKSNDKVDSISNKDELLWFLVNELLKLKNIDTNIFSYLFFNDRVAFIMDSFDEINPNYGKSVSKWLQEFEKKT